jgi:hypothetical protein
MRRVLASVFALVLVSAASAVAQYQQNPSTRAGQAADDLKRTTSRLAERTLRDAIGGPSNAPTQLDEAVLAQQIDATAALVLELVRYRRPVQELQHVTGEVTDLARRAPSFSSHGAYWRAVQDSANALSRLLGVSAPLPGPPSRPVIGRLEWRGVVDDRVHLAVRGRTLEVRTISGTGRPEGTSRFTSPLPSSAVEVDVTKLGGRGAVRVIQQPSRLNDFTAVIEINDAAGGDDEYRLEIVWR